MTPRSDGARGPRTTTVRRHVAAWLDRTVGRHQRFVGGARGPTVRMDRGRPDRSTPPRLLGLAPVCCEAKWATQFTWARPQGLELVPVMACP